MLSRLASLLITLSFVPLPVLAAEGALEVTVRPAPAAAVARGASRVPFLQVTLAASCERDVTVSELTLVHKGLGDVADLERVYAWADNVRASRAAVLTRDGEVTLRLRSFVVPACDTRELWILADLSPDAGVSAQHALTIATSADVVADAEVTLDAGRTTAPTTVGGGEAVGSVSVEMLDLPRRLTYGSTRTVARIRLTADGERPQLLRSITLTNDGSARDADLRNVVLQSAAGDDLAGPVDSMDGDVVTLVLDEPLLLGRNDTVLLVVKADVRASRRRTVRFGVEEPSDVDAVVCAGRACR